jgi:exosome complex component RRP4
MIYFKNYDIVAPGELLSDEGKGGDGTYSEGDKRIFSKYLGMLQVSERGVNVSPLTGVYEPREGDDIIGQIVEVTSKYWTVDIDAPYYTRLDARDVNFRTEIDELDRYLNIGDLIYARIFRIYSNRAADVSMRGTKYAKLPSKMITKIDPMKLPRLIGKEGAMINMIKNETNCEIVIGQNGVVWVDGEEEKKALALSAIKLVDQEYYNPDLQQKIKELFEHVRRKV